MYTFFYSWSSHLLILALTSEIQYSHLSTSCVLDVGMLSIINRDKKKRKLCSHSYMNQLACYLYAIL